MQELTAWEEKYRPQSFSEFIDADNKVSRIQRILKSGMFKHFLFYGRAGTGKTTMANILANEWLKMVTEGKNPEFYRSSIVVLNASDDRGIDIVRKRIKSIVQSSGAFVIILDEADAMTDDAQTALRRLMEQAKKGSSPKLFILTCNYPEKIIEPLHSRCEVIEFKKIPKHKMTAKLQEIVTSEGIQDFQFPDDVVTNADRAAAIKEFFDYVYDFTDGDMRKAISFTQEFVYREGERLILDLDLKKKVEAKFRPHIDILLEQVIDRESPSFENVFNFAEEYKRSNVFLNKLFHEIMRWIAKQKLNNDVKFHMGVAVAKYESRVKNRSDFVVQFSALLMELRLIYVYGFATS